MDTIFCGGKILTMDANKPLAQAVAVRRGAIAAVGTDQEILALRGPSTEIVDLQKKLLLPGFHDTHMHLLSLGYAAQKVDLTGVESLEELICTCREFRKGHPEILWLQGRGWDNEKWQENILPTRYDLDQIAEDIPVVLFHACNRLCVVNSSALRQMGLDDSDFKKKPADRDPYGRPIGRFWNEEQELVLRAIPELGEAQIRQILAETGRALLRFGITGVHSDDLEAVPDREHGRLLEIMADMGRCRTLPVRIFQQCRWKDREAVEDFLCRGYTAGWGEGLLRVAGVKILCDGVLGSRSAFLSAPYADDPSTRGRPELEQWELEQLVLTAQRYGTPCLIHAIGDGGMDMALRALERAAEEGQKMSLRHGVIHCQVMRTEQYGRLKKLGAVAYLQPSFIFEDQYLVEKRIGAQRARYSYNWRRIVDMGIPYCFGSDAPVCSSNVMEGIYAAVTRKDLGGYPPGGWMPQQRIRINQAIWGYTYGAAYAAGQERALGSIQVGKRADFAVLDRDLTETASEDIKDIQVTMTVLDGEIVYHR